MLISSWLSCCPFFFLFIFLFLSFSPSANQKPERIVRISMKCKKSGYLCWKWHLIDLYTLVLTALATMITIIMAIINNVNGTLIREFLIIKHDQDLLFLLYLFSLLGFFFLFCMVLRLLILIWSSFSVYFCEPHIKCALFISFLLTFTRCHKVDG